MIDYKEYEQKVYNWLNDKNKKDPNFTFSLRQNGSKGAELDYFIGKEKSRYFATTFWTIPVGYPGSSGDCIDIIFKFSANYLSYSYNFEFTQTNSPDEGQNTSVLNLIKSLAKPLIEAISDSYVSPESNKIFTIKTKSRKNKYANLDEMIVDIDQDIELILPIVDKCIKKERASNPEFIAHRISQEEFSTMKNKLEMRFEKYSNIKDMLFSKVTLENIKTAVNEFNQKGTPSGFSTSKYYDVKIDGILYPPKPIMAIANYYATDRKVENYFPGGINTPCFKAYERLGIEIVTKSKDMDLSEIFKIIVSKEHKDENGAFLTAKLQIVQNGYLLVKGSYIYKEPKPSFLVHSYYKMRMKYETNEYMEDSSYDGYFILKKDIIFAAPSPAAVLVLNRAANGKYEWKLEDGTTLYEFENKFDFRELIQEFLEQSKTDNLKTKQYPKAYGELKVKVSFGAGNQAEIPWIALLKEPNKVTDGIYPVYLYFKNEQKLILAYGLSETNDPAALWNIEDPTTITNYFYKNGLGKPKRYGSSYVFKVYDIVNLPDETILNDDLDGILTIYKQQKQSDSIGMDSEDVVESENIIEQEDFELSKFIEDTKASGLLFTDTLLTRFVSSLITKPFVLLSGLSGSGKTKLAQTFAKWVCEDDDQYCVVPVGADWTNREPLLGYENALNNEEYILPENGALQLVINANYNLNKPHFLILDEMNLSHVERYFADFLSVMESKEKFKLHSDNGLIKSTVPAELSWPKNLFVIGTVNIDETTYMFSPKVLDRANVIEFRVQEDEIESFLNAPKDIDFDNLIGNGSSMALDIINMASNGTNGTISKKLNSTLVLFFTQLKKTGAEFGYRTAMEIHRLFHQLTIVNTDLTTNQKIDIAIMQKLLPKLHGSRRKLCPVLESLGNLCVKEIDVKKEYFENNTDLKFDVESVVYPLSLEKITRMYKGAIDNGFASYAEA